MRNCGMDLEVVATGGGGVVRGCCCCRDGGAVGISNKSEGIEGEACCCCCRRPPDGPPPMLVKGTFGSSMSLSSLSLEFFAFL